MGASAVLSSVWPVLPSLPQKGVRVRRASAHNAGNSALTFEVKFRYGIPFDRASHA